jgi:hypothetical protein
MRHKTSLALVLIATLALIGSSTLTRGQDIGGFSGGGPGGFPGKGKGGFGGKGKKGLAGGGPGGIASPNGFSWPPGSLPPQRGAKGGKVVDDPLARTPNGREANDQQGTVVRIIVEENLDARPVVYRAGKLPGSGLPDWFKKLDVNRDGQVALAEWYKAGNDIDNFREWDRNDDGFITPEEALYKQRLLMVASARSLSEEEDALGPGPVPGRQGPNAGRTATNFGKGANKGSKGGNRGAKGVKGAG